MFYKFTIPFTRKKTVYGCTNVELNGRDFGVLWIFGRCRPSQLQIKAV